MSGYNRLLNAPPISVVVDETTYTIDTDFKAALQAWEIIEKYENETLLKHCDNDNERTIGLFNDLLIDCMYLEPKPDIFNIEALKLISEYLNAFSDNDPSRSKSKMPSLGYLQLEKDSGMLMGAFLKIGINIRSTNLTYEEFLSYLPNLPEDCEYCRIMSLRSEWYDHRHELKGKQLKDLKDRCARVGWGRILVENKEAKKEAKENEEGLKQANNRLAERIAECCGSNTDFVDGVCCREVCAVRGQVTIFKCKRQ